VHYACFSRRKGVSHLVTLIITCLLGRSAVNPLVITVMRARRITKAVALSSAIRAALDLTLMMMEVAGASRYDPAGLCTKSLELTYTRHYIIRYAMERTSDFIKVWFWPRSGAPPDVQNGDNTVNTDSWVREIDCVYCTPRCDRIN
jgi:hypothetical protein